MPKQKRMARPKTERKTYPYSFALTLKQGEFLRQFPNSSEYVRRILDDIMAEQQELDAKLPSLTLKYKIDVLEKELLKLREEKRNYLEQHDTNLHEYIDHPGPHAWCETKDKQTPDAEFHRKVLQTYTERMAGLQQRIEELKKGFV
jgi:hypothetical protein